MRLERLACEFELFLGLWLGACGNFIVIWGCFRELFYYLVFQAWLGWVRDRNNNWVDHWMGSCWLRTWCAVSFFKGRHCLPLAGFLGSRDHDFLVVVLCWKYKYYWFFIIICFCIVFEIYKLNWIIHKIFLHSFDNWYCS